MRHSKSILLLLLLLVPVFGMAQERFTDKLRQRDASGAVIEVYQDAEIELLVNGDSILHSSLDSLRITDLTKKPVKTSGAHTKENGYRVQISMAGNTAADKATVKSHAKRFKSFFPTVNAYVWFNSPHWVCQVGDFKTKKEADEMLKQVRGIFSTSYVVRSKINNFY